MPPGYTPIATQQPQVPGMTPQQMFQLMQFLNKQQPGYMDKPMTLEEFRRSQGAQNPYAPAQQQQPDIGKLVSSIGDNGGTGAVTGVATGGASGASSGLAANAGANAGWNAAGMEASGAPMTLGDSGAAASTGIGANAAGLGIGPLALIAAGTYLGGKSGWDMLHGKSDNSIPGKVGRVTLGMATGGLSEVGRHFLLHKSTRDSAKENTAKLEGMNPDDPTYQAFVRGMRDQYNSGPPDPSKPFAGKYGSWDEYKAAGLDPNDLTGVKGNLELGTAYTNLSPEQKVEFTRRAIAANLYDSSKGEVNINDQAKANQILQDYAGSGFKPALTPVPRPSPGASSNAGLNGIFGNNPTGKLPVNSDGKLSVANFWDGKPMEFQKTGSMPPVMIPRSKTKSPGVGLDGKRISYRR